MKSLGGTIFFLLVACSANENEPAASPSDAGVDSAGPRQGDGNDWSCLGKIDLPVLTTPATIDFSIISAVNATPSADTSVRACPDREDPTCANAVGPLVTDAKGQASFDVPAGFDGYWEAVEPGGFTDLHFMPFRAFRSDVHARIQWHFDEVRLLSDPIGLVFDTTKGHVLMQASDCQFTGLPMTPPYQLSRPWSRAGGVTFTLDPMPAGVTVGYVQLQPVSRVRTDIDETAEGSGAGAFMNVPPGVYTVTGKRKSTGERIGSQRIHVRADTFSLLIVVPTP